MRHNFFQAIKGGYTEETQNKGVIRVLYSAFGSQSFTQVISRINDVFLIMRIGTLLNIHNICEKQMGSVLSLSL